MLAHPPAPNASLKSPSLACLGFGGWGEWFFPLLSAAIVNIGEAATASPAGWKLDGSWMKAFMPYKHWLPAAWEGTVV